MTKPSKEALAKARQMIDQWYSEEDAIFGERALNGIAGLIQAMSDGVKRARSEQSPGAPLTKSIMRHIEQFILPDADPLAEALAATGFAFIDETGLRAALEGQGWELVRKGEIEHQDYSDIFGSIVNRALMGWSDATGPFGDGSLHQDDFCAERVEPGSEHLPTDAPSLEDAAWNMPERISWEELRRRFSMDPSKNAGGR